MPATLYNANTNELRNAHIGAAVIFYAPFGTPFPTSITSVINLTGANAFKPTAGWTALGATKTGIKVQRGFAKIDRSSDQSFGPYDSRPNNWTADVQTELLETTPQNLQLAWEGSAISTQTSIQTTISANGNPGDTQITVPAPTSLNAGQIISVGNGVYQEWHTVGTVGSASGGNVVITLGTGETLAYAHPIGDPVLVPGVQTVNFGRPTVTTARVLAVIAYMSVLDPTFVKGNLNLLRMWAFRITRLQDGQRQMTLTQEQDWVLPVGFLAYPDKTISDQNIDTFTVVDFTL